MYALKVHVERIVRPIRASVQRKNRMREELLAHLIAAYNDERKEAVSKEEAVANVIERLGAVEAVRRDLESTVPKLERIGCRRFLPGMDSIFRNEKQPDESIWRYAARGATYIVVFLTPVMLIAGAGNVVVKIQKGTTWQVSLNQFVEGLPHVIGLLACVGIAFFVSFALFDLTGIRARCSPASSTPAIAKACLDSVFGLIPLALFFGMVLRLANAVDPNHGGPSSTEVILLYVETIPLYVWILAPSILMVLAVLSKVFERRQYLEWTHINIEE